MEVGIVSMRYAKALIKYAFESKAEDKVYKEMLTLAQSFFDIPAMRSALDNPILDMKEKVSLVCTAGGIEVSEEYRRFIELVFKQRREKYLFFMSLMYIYLYRIEKNITVGRLITAYPVDKATEDRMKGMVRRVTHGDVEFDTKIDPTIEGGFIFEVGTYRLDGSIANQFRKVKKQFIEKNRRIV